MANVFWVPAQARWESIRSQAKQVNIGVRIDAALEAIEADNPRLKGILDKRFGRTQLEPGKLGELVDLISTIGFVGDGKDGHHAKDLLGEVYEYFLGQFASAEGKKGRQFYTPASVVKVLVEVMAPSFHRDQHPDLRADYVLANPPFNISDWGGDVVDVMIALPPQLFFNTQIPACLWILAKDKSGAAIPGGKKGRDRCGVCGVIRPDPSS